MWDRQGNVHQEKRQSILQSNFTCLKCFATPALAHLMSFLPPALLGTTPDDKPECMVQAYRNLCSGVLWRIKHQVTSGRGDYSTQTQVLNGRSRTGWTAKIVEDSTLAWAYSSGTISCSKGPITTNSHPFCPLCETLPRPVPFCPSKHSDPLRNQHTRVYNIQITLLWRRPGDQ